MIHVDTKQLGLLERIGNRITGDRGKGCRPEASYGKAHLAFDDVTILAYVELLPHVQMATTVAC